MEDTVDPGVPDISGVCGLLDGPEETNINTPKYSMGA